MNPTLSGASSTLEGTSKGRIPASNDSSATRAARLVERTDANVAHAKTSVPAAVAKDEIVTQSVATSTD